MLKKMRVLIIVLIFGISVLYAALPGTACFGCGSVLICLDGGDYVGSGYPDCHLEKDVWGNIVCVPEGSLGWCSGGFGWPLP